MKAVQIKDVKYCPWCAGENLKNQTEGIAVGLNQFVCKDCKVLFWV